MKGKLILVVGSSGSGKSTLISSLKKEVPEIVFPISCTTRTPRPMEKEGDVYHFVSQSEFDARIQRGEFLEWASYGGNRYGTLKSEILIPLQEGKIVVREVNMDGVRQIHGALSSKQVITIFVYGGDWGVLDNRIQSRSPMSPLELEERRRRYEEEAIFMKTATYLIKNKDGDLSSATQEFITIIRTIESAR